MYRNRLVKLTPHARFSTICLHAGQEPDPSTGAIITPIYQTSTYVQDELGKHKGFEYGRTQNPTRLAVERNLAAIEGGQAGFAFASGMAAIGAIATMLRSGDHVIVSDNTYGGTFRLFDKVLTRYQLSFSYLDTSKLDEVEGAMTPATRMLFVENAEGAILSPFDSWLVLRGTKTLPLRMQQHSANGFALAEFLSAHPKVKHVYYPGLPTHPQYDLAKRQMRGFGGMLAFDLGSLEAARRVLNSVRLHALAESLGGVETLISHPATMTHASVPADRRAALGITDGMVRISAGIEDIEDLKEDLAQALDLM